MPNIQAYDTVICGAGLAGLTLARQLKQTMPSITIALLDRLANPLPTAAFKVGEATTEIGLTKLIAPYAYNIDRGLFESDLRNKVAAAGVDLLEHSHIRDIVISSREGQYHEVAYARHGSSARRGLRARWVIDAMGRRRFLSHKLGLAKPNLDRYSAAWLRMAGRVDVGEFVAPTEKSWHRRVPDSSRYNSTNHLCGPGYWVWLIGLSSGYTSIGLVADEAVHPFTQYNSYPKLYRWLQRHEPSLASQLAHRVQRLFQDWAAATKPRGRFDFINYLALPFVKDLRRRNLQSNKSNDELLAELPPKPCLNAWAIGLNDARWREDRLFSPASKPRDLRPVWDLLRGLIKFPVPVAGPAAAVPAVVQRAALKSKAGDPGTLPESLRRAAGGDKGLVYVQQGGTDIEQSYNELLEDVTRICGGLRAYGMEPGDIVILQLPLTQDLIPALWGCLLGGFVAAPVAVPVTYSKDAAAVNRFWTAWASLDRPLIVTTQTLGERFDTESVELTENSRRPVSVQQLRSSDPDDDIHVGSPDDLAILLLTSGSTGTAKAVQLRHDSILTRAAGRQRHFRFSSRDISVNWFPLDHVASLVMFHLRDVYLSCRQVHAPTQPALENPLRWLDWAPNFAYALVNDQARKISRGNWDLSSVRCILNGGEPIDFKTASTFR